MFLLLSFSSFSSSSVTPILPILLLYPSFTTSLLPLTIPSHVSDRSGSFNRGCDSHSVHSSYLLRADRPDLPHPAYDGGSNPGQHGGPGPAALAVRLHYPSQEAAIPAGAWLWTHEVCHVSKEVLLCCFSIPEEKVNLRELSKMLSVET